MNAPATLSRIAAVAAEAMAPTGEHDPFAMSGSHRSGRLELCRTSGWLDPPTAHLYTYRVDTAQSHTVIDTAPDPLLDVHTIGPARVAGIVRAWAEHMAVHEVVVFLR